MLLEKEYSFFQILVQVPRDTASFSPLVLYHMMIFWYVLGILLVMILYSCTGTLVDMPPTPIEIHIIKLYCTPVFPHLFLHFFIYRKRENFIWCISSSRENTYYLYSCVYMNTEEHRFIFFMSISHSHPCWIYYLLDHYIKSKYGLVLLTCDISNIIVGSDLISWLGIHFKSSSIV